MRFDEACSICGSDRLKPFATRSDGIPVITCAVCGHGVVQHFPDDLHLLYDNAYFDAGGGSTAGYGDYEYTSEHGIAWAAALIRLLRPGGRMLDIGCAGGHLLSKLDGTYECFGIEANQQMAGQCRSAGISIIGSDISDNELRLDYAGFFEVVSAIAVFEHIPDFRGAVEAALAMLRPDGILLFEVPVVIEGDTANPWLRTSLEHIHYPVERSMRFLFTNVLGLELAGSVVSIRDFAHTFIGITSRSGEVMRRASEAWQRWTVSPPASLEPEEARFRWLLNVIHAGNATPEVLALYRHLQPEDWNPLIVRRVMELWSAAEQRTSSLREYLHQVEAARDWHAAETIRRESAAADRNRLVEPPRESRLTRTIAGLLAKLRRWI